MFRTVRPFPFRGFLLIALGFLVASSLAGSGGSAGAAAGIGALLAFPFFLMKMFFLFMIISAFFRFAGGGPRRSGWHHHATGPRGQFEQDPEAARSRVEWEESLRLAREEIQRVERSAFPEPGDFEPTPQDRTEDADPASRDA